MKNILLFVLACIFISSGCSSIESTSLIVDRTLIREPRPKEVVPYGHKLNEYAMQIGRYSLADLDDYYRNELSREKAEAYYNNARKMVISSMVQSYGLAEKGDDASIAFYLNEVQELKLMQPDVTLRLLTRAEKSMTPEEVKNIAGKIYDFNQKAIAGLDNPQQYLADMGQKWEEIRRLSER
jgi:hypothetical protein